MVLIIMLFCKYQLNVLFNATYMSNQINRIIRKNHNIGTYRANKV